MDHKLLYIFNCLFTHYEQIENLTNKEEFHILYIFRPQCDTNFLSDELGLYHI